MRGYVPYNYLLSNVPSVGASQTNKPISRQFPITAGGSRHIIVAVLCTNVTVATGITLKLQSGIDGNFFDSKTVTVTGNGTFFIKLNVEVTGDQTYLPLLPAGQVVCTTGAGDTVSFTTCNIVQEL